MGGRSEREEKTIYDPRRMGASYRMDEVGIKNGAWSFASTSES